MLFIRQSKIAELIRLFNFEHCSSSISLKQIVQSTNFAYLISVNPQSRRPMFVEWNLPIQKVAIQICVDSNSSIQIHRFKFIDRGPCDYNLYQALSAMEKLVVK